MSTDTPRRWRLAERSVLSLTLITLAALFIYFDTLWEWDQVIYDWQLRRWTRTPADNVVIVAIDEQSLAELGRWPWSRAVHADVVQRIHASGARVIGLDVVFAEASADDPEGDRQLTRIIDASNNVVLPVLNAQQRLGGQLIEILPLPELSRVATLGHVDRQLDRDAVARSAYLKAGLGEPRWPSFALAMLQLSDDQAWGRLPGLRNPRSDRVSPFTWTRDHQIWIPYAGPPGQYPRASFVDVLKDRVSDQLFREKLVLIGATAAGLGDLLPTPVSGDRHPMPGVEVIANEIDTLQSGLAVLPLAMPWRLLVTVILVLVPAWLYPRAPRWSLPIWLAFSVATLVIGWIMLRNAQLWYPPAAALTLLLAGYVMWGWRRLVQTLRYLNQELSKLHHERTITHRPDTVPMDEAVAFLSQMLPIQGHVMLDASDRVQSHTGDPPPVFAEPPQLGRWAITLPALWTALSRGPDSWRLGIYWSGETAPEAAELKLLTALVHHCESAPDTRPRSPVEFLQSRILQVQAATERLQSMRRFIMDTLAQLAYGVVVSDALGRVLMTNSRAVDYFAAADSEALERQQLSELLTRLDYQGEQNWPQLLRRVLLWSETVTVAAKSPAGKDLLIQISPFDYESEDLQGILVNLADVTALKESERRRRELMAFLSHDLRMPLTSIIALTGIAKLKPERYSDLKYVESIEQNARKTLKLADDFLQLARAEMADTSVFCEVDLVDLAGTALNAVRAQASAKDIALDSDLPDAAPLLGDGDLLERALTNLLSNAIKYSPDGARVTLGMEHNGKAMIHSWIRDTGYGIAEQDLPQIFTRFKRIDRDEHREERGSGLGLAFVKTVIERHHGSIELESRVGRGTCVHLYLPRAEDGP